MSLLLSWFLSRVFTPFKEYILAGLTILAVVGTIFTKGFLKGRSSERKAQQEAVAKVEQRWHETDRANLDFDDAVDRLRQRSRKGR